MLWGHIFNVPARDKGDAMNADQPDDVGPLGPASQQIQHSPASARVPDKVSRGVFSTGLIVLQAGHEFVFDFLQRLTRPPQVAARVIVPAGMMPGLLGALRDNIQRYESTFGSMPSMQPPPAGATPTPLDQVYADLKLPDDMLGGVYANAALISHSQAEFCIDFITNFYPRSAVTCRVYLAAAHIPNIIQTLNQALKQFQQRLPPGAPPKPPEER